MKKFTKFIAIFLIFFPLMRTAEDTFDPYGVSVMSETDKPPLGTDEEEEIIQPYGFTPQ